jgi:hypothetical protein
MFQVFQVFRVGEVKRGMRTLRISDETDGYLAFDLRELLELLGERVVASRWVCAVEECRAEEPLTMIAKYNVPEGIDGKQIIRLAAVTRQVVDGVFAGFDDAEPEPWVRLAAIDSSYWEVTAAENVLLPLVASFRDTRFLVADDSL